MRSARSHLRCLCTLVPIIFVACGVDANSSEEEPAPEALPIKNGITDIPAIGVLAGPAGTCTATLISSRVVLTAAHCVGFEDKSLLGVNGGHPSFLPIHSGTFFTAQGAGGMQSSEVGRMWVAGKNYGMYDVAVLELLNDISSAIATPLKVARDFPKDGSDVTVWGVGAISGTVNCSSPAGCGWNPDVMFLPSGFTVQHVNDTWQGRTTAHGVGCPGDSGGPTLNDELEIIAVQSAGSCTTPNGGLDSKGDVIFHQKQISNLKAVFGRAEVCDLCGRYAFRTDNGHYLQAVDEGGGALTADPTWAEVWETFRLVGLGPGWFALQTANGHFISAENGGGGDVTASAELVGPWEAFRSDYSYTFLETMLTHQYVSAIDGGGNGLEASASEKGVWETFAAELQQP